MLSLLAVALSLRPTSGEYGRSLRGASAAEDPRGGGNETSDPVSEPEVGNYTTYGPDGLGNYALQLLEIHNGTAGGDVPDVSELEVGNYTTSGPDSLGNYALQLLEMHNGTASGGVPGASGPADPVSELEVGNYNKKTDGPGSLGNYFQKLLEMHSGTAGGGVPGAAGPADPVSELEVGNYNKLGNYFQKLLEMHNGTAGGGVPGAGGPADPVSEPEVGNYNKLGNYFQKLLEMHNGTAGGGVPGAGGPADPVSEPEVGNYKQNVGPGSLGNYFQKLLEMHNGAAGGVGNHRRVAASADAIADALNSSGHAVVQPTSSSVKSSSGVAGKVHILEFFHDEASFYMYLQHVGTARNASIMSTSPQLYGKRIRKYRAQHVLPEQAVIVSCHPWNPFEKTPLAIAASQGLIWGFCHSPPTTSQMVHSEVELEDGAVEQLTWACHAEGLEKKMCHAVNMVVVDPAVLRASVVSGR